LTISNPSTNEQRTRAPNRRCGLIIAAVDAILFDEN
jgi:hypothetical protein